METSVTENGKSKTTYMSFFHLKFVKVKKIFTILALKQRTQKNVSSHYTNIREDY